MRHALTTLMALTAASASGTAPAAPQTDRQSVGRLDVEFQAAVKVNDAPTMARILHKDMILVLRNGRTNTREELPIPARRPFASGAKPRSSRRGYGSRAS